MPKAGDIKYCDLLGGRKTNAVFVFIPPSAFWMGNASMKGNSVHLVGVSKGFWIQQTELTEEQYEYLTTKHTYSSANSKNPKTEISWKDVISFISNKPFRLSTEAEWELAARAGVGHKYLWAGSNMPDNVAWTAENSESRVNDVAELKPNSIGLYDLSGNVNEWCSDWYSRLYSAPQFNPQGPASGSARVDRGGSWGDDPLNARVACRYGSNPNTPHRTYGVRLIWEI